jgi:hypothetical protein
MDKVELVQETYEYTTSALTTCDPFAVAQLINHIMKPLVCTDLRKCKFWQHRRGLWIRVYFKNFYVFFGKYLYSNKTGFECDDAQYDLEKIDILLKKMKMSYYARQVKHELAHICFNNEFTKKLNPITNELPIHGGLIVNLTTGRVRLRNEDDHFTYELPSYKHGAKHALVDKYLDDLFPEMELRDYLQILLGSALTATSPGKTIYMIVLDTCRVQRTSCAGDNEEGYALFSLIEDIIHTFVDRLPESRCLPRKGKRLNIIEFEESEFDSGCIKYLVGGDDHMIHKVFGIANHVPSCAGQQALLQRIQVIRLETHQECATSEVLTQFVTEPKSSTHRKANPNIANEILADDDAVTAFFSWLVDGAIRFLNGEMVVPQSVLLATETYRNADLSDYQDCWQITKPGQQRIKVIPFNPSFVDAKADTSANENSTAKSEPSITK